MSYIIHSAILASIACMVIVYHDLRNAPGNPYAVMRVPVASAWAVAWLVYGLNPAHFPRPAPISIALLTVACIGSLLAIPSPPLRRGDSKGFRSVPVSVYAPLLLMPLGVIAWDIAHIIEAAGRSGLINALVSLRLDRGGQTGAYALPGADAAHAAAMALGALGYCVWIREKHWVGLLGGILGLMVALLSTGRWDVVTYALWCFTLKVTLSTPKWRGLRGALVQFALLGILGIFFLGHGELYGKISELKTLSRMSSEGRLSKVNTSANIGMAPGAELSAKASPLCERWAEGLPRSNRSFQEFSRLIRVLVLYLAGPLAGLDRVECQPETVVRPVIFYWPKKLGELAGLTAKAPSPTVDPFVDIGLPTNNFTVIYSFRWELGTVAGSVVWIGFALVVRWFITCCFERAGSLPLVVAASSVAALVVRTPWSNAFFDGTVLVWIFLLGSISVACDLISPRNKHASRT